MIKISKLVFAVILLLCTSWCLMVAIYTDNNLAAWAWGLLSFGEFTDLIKVVRKQNKKRRKKAKKDFVEEPLNEV